MTYSDASRLRLVELIYKAVTEPQDWRLFLDAFAETVGSGVTAMFVQDLQDPKTGNLAEVVRIAPDFHASFNSHYSAKNVFVERGKHLFKQGNLRLSHELVPDGELMQSEFYTGWLAPQDLFYGIGATILAEGSLTSQLTSFRSRNDGAFGKAESDLVKFLMPHMQQALKIRQQIQAVQDKNDVTSFVLDRLPIGALVLDENARVIELNRRARQIVEKRDGLAVTAGVLHTTFHDDTAALQRMIADAARTAFGNGTYPGGAMSVSRSSSGRPISVVVTSVPPSPFVFGNQRGFVVAFANDPDLDIETVEETLCEMYGLTQAESRLTLLLMQGRDLDEAADELRISRETARTHLKHIFLKTDTNRQSSLIRLLLTSPAVMNLSSR